MSGSHHDFRLEHTVTIQHMPSKTIIKFPVNVHVFEEIENLVEDEERPHISRYSCIYHVSIKTTRHQNHDPSFTYNEIDPYANILYEYQPNSCGLNRQYFLRLKIILSQNGYHQCDALPEN